MRVMVLVKATKHSEAGEMPSEELMAAMGKFNEELQAAGIIRAGEGLKPTSEALRVRFSGKNRTVTDGPFPETKELVAGFWLWEVKSMEEALDWVKRCPNPMMEDSDIEIRPLYELADFADSDPSGEMREQESDLRQAISMREAKIDSYLFFNGCCEEALEFYKTSLSARVDAMMRYSDSPEPMPEGQVPEGYENKIMHASFTVGQTMIMCSDACDESGNFEGFRQALSLADADTAKRVFEDLSKGGTVDMPLSETFWSPCFGMLTDKFGIGWMVMVADAEGCSQ